MAKKRRIVKFSQLTKKQQNDINIMYPNGFKHAPKLLLSQDNKSFYAIEYETETCLYLVKIDVNIDYKYKL